MCYNYIIEIRKEMINVEALRQTVAIPNDHKITISIPEYIKDKYAEVIVIFKQENKIKEEKNEKREIFISDKVKSISGVLKSEKNYKELRDEVMEERKQRYEDIL